MSLCKERHRRRTKRLAKRMQTSTGIKAETITRDTKVSTWVPHAFLCKRSHATQTPRGNRGSHATARHSNACENLETRVPSLPVRLGEPINTFIALSGTTQSFTKTSANDFQHQTRKNRGAFSWRKCHRPHIYSPEISCIQAWRRVDFLYVQP